jgi:hypothetical protein
MDKQNKAQITAILRGLGDGYRFCTIQKRKNAQDNTPYYVVRVKRYNYTGIGLQGCDYIPLTTDDYNRIETAYNALNIDIPLKVIGTLE